MSKFNFNVIKTEDGKIIKAWSNGVVFEENTIQQFMNVVELPFVRPYAAAMPDAHFGFGAPIGAVIPTIGAICPSLVGSDIGCGMMAVRTNADKDTFKNCLPEIRKRIEKVVPHGRTNDGNRGDRGAWFDVPDYIKTVWAKDFEAEYEDICQKHPGARAKNSECHLGTLGTGNHFIEISLDEFDRAWIVLHSGSRGLGNRIGSYFTQVAKDKCEAWMITLPDPNLAYLPVACPEYADYIKALYLAQRFALSNRRLMMKAIIGELSLRGEETIECHHNYMSEENHFGEDVILTRKGAVDASLGKLVIIPGSMGDKTYIARGLGSVDSFHSCSHGSGRSMGRKQAERTITPEQHMASLAGIECHNGPETIDESPSAYKPVDAVMAAQTDLVEPVHVLHQIINVKGWAK